MTKGVIDWSHGKTARAKRFKEQQRKNLAKGAAKKRAEGAKNAARRGGAPPGRKVCSKCGKQRQLKFFRSLKARICLDCQRKQRQQTSRASRVVDTYNLTTSEFNQIMQLQGGKCAICKGTRPYSLDIDHDHKVEATQGMRASIRGLLCRQCNRRVLTAAKDNPEILRAAADYLEQRPAQWVLGEYKEPDA